MPLSPDSLALVLLCSRLGILPESELTPLTLREWNPLARKLQSISLRPGDLLGASGVYLQDKLDLPEVDCTRLERLLERAGALAIILERLESIGIRILTRADSDYPARYRQRLKESAPAVLFYAGEKALLGQPGIAVVGSRHLDEIGEDCAVYVGNACGLSGMVLYSGGAKGVDTLSMNAALEARGTAVGILADSLERAIRAPEARAAIHHGDLCLASPYSPDAGFSVGAAMGRNRLIYTLADYAIVVASEAGKGGTWGGATEALRAGWLPVFALEHADMPDGNRLLLQKGGLAFPHPFPIQNSKLVDWLCANTRQVNTPSTQLDLF
jgi:predicted Rossmann fold nucleotide-binding protein DprA/Smf involved in DNA uptake